MTANRPPGRPPELEDARPLTIRLGRDTRAALDRLCEERGMGVAEAIRWLVEEWARREPGRKRRKS